MVEIPVLDCRLTEAELTPLLRSACERVGFFYLENHGLEALQARLTALALLGYLSLSIGCALRLRLPNSRALWLRARRSLGCLWRRSWR